MTAFCPRCSNPSHDDVERAFVRQETAAGVRVVCPDCGRLYGYVREPVKGRGAANKSGVASKRKKRGEKPAGPAERPPGAAETNIRKPA